MLSSAAAGLPAVEKQHHQHGKASRDIHLLLVTTALALLSAIFKVQIIKELNTVRRSNVHILSYTTVYTFFSSRFLVFIWYRSSGLTARTAATPHQIE